MKKILSITFILSFITSLAWGNITYVDSLAECDLDHGSTMSTTATMTLTACDDGVPYIVCAATCEDADFEAAVTDMDWNTTENFTQIRKDTVIGLGTTNPVNFWYISNPTVMTSGIDTDFDDACYYAATMCVALCGAKDQAPEVDNGDTPAAGNATVDVTTVTAGAWVIDGVNANMSSATLTVDGSQTERENFVCGGSFVNAMSTEEDTAIGVVSMDWTISGGGHAQSVAAIAPESFVGSPHVGLQGVGLQGVIID